MLKMELMFVQVNEKFLIRKVDFEGSNFGSK